MADSQEVQRLQKISAEVDESQIKVICSTQCIKAQAHIAAKLRKQAERLKENSGFIARANLKLQSEITQADLKVKRSGQAITADVYCAELRTMMAKLAVKEPQLVNRSSLLLLHDNARPHTARETFVTLQELHLLIAQETIKMSNVELKKEWLLAQDNKVKVMERVKNGEKKYENLWLESKARYESLSFVQKLLKATDEVKILEQLMTKLDNEKTALIEKIEAKKEICLELDRKRIVELAEFMVYCMPKMLSIIKEKSADISAIIVELNNIDFESKAYHKIEEPTQFKGTKDDSKTEKNWSLAENDNNISAFMPKLQLSYLDFDVLSVKLDKAKEKASNKTPTKNMMDTISQTIDASKVNSKIENREEYSSFFNMPSVVYQDNKPKNYAKMKLINILEDVKIDTSRAHNIMAKVNPEKLHLVDSISVDIKTSDAAGGVPKNKEKEPIVSEEIEEIDLTTPNTDLLLMPPTQFLDITQEQAFLKEPQEEALNFALTPNSKERQNLSQALKTSQESLNKKKVSFDLPNTLERNVISGSENHEINDNETLNSPLDVSAVSDDGFAKIKDMMMKKHNLNVSPQFVYAKNIITSLNLKHSEDAVVTSKFFQEKKSNAEPEKEETMTIDNQQDMEVNDFAANTKGPENKSGNKSKKDNNQIVDKDFDADIVSNPKKQKIDIQSDKPVSGFMFSHDAPISESLDASMNTLGYEDGDDDYPRCIDSSLLLSPKADIQMPPTANVEVVSQDVPNFLSGLRKTGFSFFGQLPSSEPKPGSSAENQAGGFNFNFGGEEKKTRGGLFSMFK